MKYLQYFEKIKNKNIKVGNIYRTDTIYSNETRESYIPLVKIISIDGNMLNVKTYTTDNYKERNFNIYKTWLTNIASPSEINQFELIEQADKYNL